MEIKLGRRRRSWGGLTVVRICSIHPQMTAEGMKEVVRSLDGVAKDVAREM